MNIKSTISNLLKRYCLFSIFLFTGLSILLYPMFFISFELMPGDLADGRFINYILEHGFLFVKQAPLHQSFWDLPIFYPTPNTISYSDFLLGSMFLYVPIRFFVKSPQTSMQIWLILACILNYCSMYLLLKILNFKNLPSSIGAFLFAFCLTRNIQICHLQLYSQFYMIFSLSALLCLNKNNTKLKNHLLFFAGSVLLVIQLYTTFYFGFFTIFAFFISMVIASFFKESRTKMFDFIWFYKKEIILYSLLSLILLIPLFTHYLATNMTVPFDQHRIIDMYNFLVSDSLLDSYIYQHKFPYELEHQIGVGYITTLLIVAGIFLNKKYRKYIILFLLLCILFFGEQHFHYALYKIFPGANVIRAVGRIFFLMLPLYCISLAFLCQNLKNKILITVICLLVVIEQIPNTIYFEWTKTEHNKRIAEYKVPDNCSVVAYILENIEPDWKITNDIMWVGTRDKVYTVNGYTGHPPEYDYNSALPECTFTLTEELPVKNEVLDIEHRWTVYNKW